MLSLFGGVAVAQRCLPGMSAVEARGSMVDGFFTGKSRDCGYSFGVSYLRFVGNHANTWEFGAEYLQTYKPYAENGRIPVVQFTGEAGFNLHLLSDYSKTFHLYAGLHAVGGYESVNFGRKLLADGATIKASDSFIYGGAVSAGMDFYLSDSVALGLQLRERFIFGNHTGHTHFSYGLSIKYVS